jgi:pyridoxamine 5'-phosphate oxidase
MIDPLQLFTTQFAAAQHVGLTEPCSVVLASCDMSGNPSARVLLLREIDERGLVFYTNLASRKAEELRANPKAALCFHWMPLKRQVRIEGLVEQISDEQAEQYFAKRSRDSQLGAWASKQSQIMENESDLQLRLKLYHEKFAGKPVTRPPFWSGLRLVPHYFEFWQEGEYRLHSRTVYIKENEGWVERHLFP